MLSFDVIYSQFLTSVPEWGEAAQHLTKEELQMELYNLLVPAIADFNFPQVSLDFDPVYGEGEEPSVVSGTFKNNVTQREINVLLALMRVKWMESVINRESRYERYYYDANMRTHSQGNLLSQMNKRAETLRKDAREAIFNYSRRNSDGTPNVDRYKWE